MKPAPAPRPTERVDERDTMFARMARRPGTPAYEEYYSRHPELKDGDDQLRSRPGLLQPGGRHFDSQVAGETRAFFEQIDSIEVDPAFVEQWRERLLGAADRTATVKEMVLALGAVEVGATPLEPEYVYTHKGRFDDDYGQPVVLDHPRAIVFLVEMDFAAMQRAPRAEVIRESARQYWRAARIARWTEAVLRAAGHRARSHYDAHYDVILPALAERAGLGELGRHNILIAERFGTRVRIGAVTTDLEIVADEPVPLGALAFCRLCKKCADNCPSHALSRGEREEVRGVHKWPTHVERCYGYWRAVGTDCGICMAVCPFSHRDNWFHNLVRWMVRRLPWSARPALWCDDLVYGRRWPGAAP